MHNHNGIVGGKTGAEESSEQEGGPGGLAGAGDGRVGGGAVGDRVLAPEPPHLAQDDDVDEDLAKASPLTPGGGEEEGEG